jgi:hypothetical protein
MQMLEVFAEIACPFAHAGLAQFRAFREQRGLAEPRLRVRAWPLAPKVEALRADVATDRFAGFDPDRFPTTSLPALISEAAAYRAGDDVGERFSLAVRGALFDDGEDVSDPDVLRRLRAAYSVDEPNDDDEAAVHADYAEGQRRGVIGSPHFFTPDGSFFCTSLQIEHDDAGYDISFDRAGFERFIEAVFGGQ